MELSKKLPPALAVLVLAGLIVFPAGKGGCVSPAGAAGEPEPPITVTADRMDYYSDRDVVIFIGNAIAIRGDARAPERHLAHGSASAAMLRAGVSQPTLEALAQLNQLGWHNDVVAMRQAGVSDPTVLQLARRPAYT